MKILVTGCYGQLGNSLRIELENDPEIEAMYTDYDTLDITDRDAVGRCLAENKFDFVVNCAAYTAVDRAETDDLKAAALNTGAVGNLGEAAARNGTANRAWVEKALEEKGYEIIDDVYRP